MKGAGGSNYPAGSYAGQYQGQSSPNQQNADAAAAQEAAQAKSKGGGLDFMNGLLLPLAQTAAQAWADGGNVGDALRSSAPGILGGFLGSAIGGPFGGIIGTLATGLFGSIFGKKKNPRESVRPIPVVIMNWDVLGSMLNITRSGLIRSGQAGYSSLASIRTARGRVGI
jgi:hypothetical protein